MYPCEKIMKLTPAIASICLLTACASSSNKGIVTPVYVDPNLPQKEVAYAINDWNAVMNGTYVLKVVPWQDDPPSPAIVILSSHSHDAPIMISGPTTLAITHVGEGTAPSSHVFINVDKVKGILTISVLEHELGHSFGADHMPNTLMEEYIRGSHCIDEATVHQVAKALNLDEGKLKPAC